MAPQLPISSYSPLRTSTAIRLLKILPDLRDGHLVCIVEQFPQDQAPPYDALSYLWGDETQTHRIFIHMDGANIRVQGVHTNLWEFLDQMYMMQKTEGYYWADFLCLDQTSEEEMQHQVPRMGQIYSGASRTISWLGRPASSSPTEIRNLEVYMDRLEEWNTKTGQDAEAVLARFPADLYKMERRGGVQVDLDYPSKSMLQSLKLGLLYHGMTTIMAMPYWTRTWVVQEVALSRKVDISFGAKAIDFDSFFLPYRVWALYLGSHHGRLVPIEARKTLPRVSVTDVLDWGSRTECSKPVDRIYGMLGLLRHSEHGPSYFSFLEADYSKTPNDLFWELYFSLSLAQTTSLQVSEDVRSLRECLSCREDNTEALEAFLHSHRGLLVPKSMAWVYLRVREAHQAKGPQLRKTDMLERLSFEFQSSDRGHLPSIWRSLLSSRHDATNGSEINQSQIIEVVTSGLRSFGIPRRYTEWFADWLAE